MKRSGDLPAGIAIVRAAEITVWSSTLTAEQEQAARYAAAALAVFGSRAVVLTVTELDAVMESA